MKQSSIKRAQRERGAALIEFALLVSSLLLLCLGFVSLSLAITQSITLTACAQAGARYGAAEGNANDTSGMTAAANKAAFGMSGMTVHPKTWCACTAGGSQVSCTSTCNSYDLPVQYVKVQTSATIPLLFHFAGIPLNIRIAGNAVMRAR